MLLDSAKRTGRLFHSLSPGAAQVIGCQVLASLCYSVRGWLLGPACSPAPRAQTIFIADVDMIIGRTLAVVLLCEVSAQWLFALNSFCLIPRPPVLCAALWQQLIPTPLPGLSLIRPLTAPLNV